MPTLAGAGVQEYRLAAGIALPDIRPAVGASSVVAAIHGHAWRDMINPAQTSFGISVALCAASRLSEQSAGERSFRSVKTVLGWRHGQHRRMKSAMDHEIGPMPEPTRSARDFALNALSQRVVQLFDGRADDGFGAREPGEDPGEFEVMIAQQKQSATPVDQIEHDAQRPGAVGAVIGQVAKLHHEPVGRSRVGEGRGIAMDITHHTNGGAGRRRGWIHASSGFKRKTW
jgi:hypothetical protein